MKNSFRIAEISFAESHWDASYEFTLAGKNFEVQRFGANYSLETVKQLIRQFRLEVDAFAFVSDRRYLEIMNMPSSIPICDGTGLKEISNIKTYLQLIHSGQVQPNLGTYFPTTTANKELQEFLQHRHPQTVFQRASDQAQYVVGDLQYVLPLVEKNDFLIGKDLITWSSHLGLEKEIKKFGVRRVINLFPEEYRVSPYMNYPVLEAALRLAHNRESALSFEEWENLLGTDHQVGQMVRNYTFSQKAALQIKISKSLYGLRDQLIRKQKPEFAFVVHALSHEDFERIPFVGNVIKAIPQNWNDSFDSAMTYLPPVIYGEIKNVVSVANGKTVNGLIYGLPYTPKMLKQEDPEAVYKKIQLICMDAAARGIKIIGLGAYTKVVGDSGITINQNSPIPVTTGNSLSASATLWGLYDVVTRTGLLSVDKNSGHVMGTAMVIGATGSIGKVSAKLLALAFEKLILVAPRLERLQELKLEIEKHAPNCKVTISTDANELAAQADVMVTATSAFDQKIVDVMNLKPGCIVCDCSRPLDFTKEDARKRPDVLIMESGELILPGPYRLTCDIGLPGKTVYACLAETAILALEGQFESFTLGRDIDWIKVKEIYRLSKKHGVKLAEIQGHMGTIGEAELKIFKELALKARANQKTSREENSI